MIISTRYFLLAAFACLALTCKGQTVVWQLMPTDYHDIVRLKSDLFKVTRNGKVGLIRSDGTVVAPIENDQIGDFYERKALVTRNDGKGERISGYLTEEGNYTAFPEAYYTLAGQKFFSDGLLSVANASGKVGYIDTYGNEVIGFDGKYNRIKPFTEGFAAVRKGEKYVLIDKDGNEQRFEYGGNGIGAAIGGCTNVYQGIAYVYDEYGGNDRSYFTYDAKWHSKLQKTRRIRNTEMDYLYCYREVTGRTKEVPFQKAAPYRGSKGPEATATDGLYGYTTDGKQIVPPQFTSATTFEDGLAIVTADGKEGILKYVEGSGFAASAVTESLSFDAGSQVTCKFRVAVPGIWQSRGIELILKDNAGNVLTTAGNADTRSFTVRPTASGRATYHLSIHGEGLTLYEGTLTYTFHKKEVVRPTVGTEKKKDTEKRCPTCGLPISQCPYQGVH